MKKGTAYLQQDKFCVMSNDRNKDRFQCDLKLDNTTKI